MELYWLLDVQDWKENQDNKLLSPKQKTAIIINMEGTSILRWDYFEMENYHVYQI